MTSSSSVIVCVKWAPPRLSADVAADERYAELSAADQAALELGLRTAETSGDEVVVVTVGPASSEKILRSALACGATRAIRIDAPAEAATLESAAAVAHVVSAIGETRLIWCGDYSSDRGSGTFPAFLAAHLNLEQCLGLIRVDFPDRGSFPLEVVRRLDGGRRQRSRVSSCAVLSVEGSLTRLRRAPLSRTLAAQSQQIEVVDAGFHEVEPPADKPFRPRARTIVAPKGTLSLDRIRSVTETTAAKGSGDPLHLEPVPAAELILERLREWGYTR